MASWNHVVDKGRVTQPEPEEIKELATTVMALMREDEHKLIRQVKKLNKKNKSLTAQIVTTDIEGWTPVHACALRGTKKLMKVFLNSGIDINVTMGKPEGLPSDCTLLHLSALRGDLKHLEFLISKGADVNAKDSCDMTPVMYAARRRHKRAFRLLQEHGANTEGVEFPVQVDMYECITPQPHSMKFCFF